jgi:hypothetical protein
MTTALKMKALRLLLVMSRQIEWITTLALAVRTFAGLTMHISSLQSIYRCHAAQSVRSRTYRPSLGADACTSCNALCVRWRTVLPWRRA